MTAGSYRYVVVGLCSVVLFLDYANRNNINNAIVSMTQDDHGNENNGSLVFHYCASSTNESAKYPKTGECGVQQKVARMGPTYDWSPTTQGVILGSFYYGYVLLQIPSGRLSELFGGKVMVTVGLTVCGFIPLITPWITQSVPWLIASRILLGMFQGVIVPAVFSINANWMSVHEKSFGFGLIGAGANLGSMVASGTTGYISQNYGWPYSFIGIGALTMIWTLTCWLCFVRSKPPDLDPVSSCTTLNIEIVCSDSAGDSTTENDLVETPPTIPWIGMLSNPAVISVGLCTFCASFGDKVIDTKLPAYLDSVLHESIDQVLLS